MVGEQAVEKVAFCDVLGVVGDGVAEKASFVGVGVGVGFVIIVVVSFLGTEDFPSPIRGLDGSAKDMFGIAHSTRIFNNVSSSIFL